MAVVIKASDMPPASTLGSPTPWVVITAKTFTGKFKHAIEEQILALSGLLAARDAMAEKLLKEVASDKSYPGPLKVALSRLRAEQP